jgi:hypothetical protein
MSPPGVAFTWMRSLADSGGLSTMIHTVHITQYTPRTDQPGRIAFQLDGKTYHARCYADQQLAQGVLVEGATYPLALTVHAQGKVEYATAGTPALEVTQPEESGDTVRAFGRTWDVVDHETVKLDAAPTVGLKLNLPQMATDFRGGSWLSAVGVLCADLPPDDHD